MACGPEKSEWDKCLSKSGKNPDKCLAAEDALRKCGNASEMNFCISETRGLMACSLRPSAEQCATEFIKMRECNRPGGPKLLAGETLSIAPGKGSQFKDGASFIPAPATTTAAMMEFADGFAKKLGIAEGVTGIRF
jgi:hypothetical protein